MTETSDLRLDDQLCFALYSASATIVRAYRPMLEKIGLTYPQFLVMIVLWEDDDISVGTLADRLDLPANGLAPVLDRLVKAGLVERHRDASDRRVHRMRLTDAGRDLQHEGRRIASEVACKTRLSDAEIVALRGAIQHLTAAMHDDSPLPTEQPVANGVGTA